MLSTSLEQRLACAEQLEKKGAAAGEFKAFLGLDGFVDFIVHVVDKRHGPESFTRIPTIERFAQRIASAAGRSTNIELVQLMEKLGGNGPIMGNALAAFGLKVTYVGCLGWPELHPVFKEFAQRAQVYSIAGPGLTYAFEFQDGKLLFGLHQTLREITWENICQRWSRKAFEQHFTSADLVGFLNWTMLPYMSQIWEAVIKEIVPYVSGPRRPIFFDLADPEKRTPEDIQHALQLIGMFRSKFDTILGLNEKEAYEIGKALGLTLPPHTPEGIAQLGLDIQKKIQVGTLVIHPVAYALTVSNGTVTMVAGPYTPEPLITTGAGDHFNSGFCLGRLLGLSDEQCLLTAVTTSGFYVRTAKSPSISDLVTMLRNEQISYKA